MSSDETQSALSRAYELVEAGNFEEARAILDPILMAEPNNADAWWVYAHAVTSAEDGRNALENVVRLDPRYPGASELLAQARSLAPEAATSSAPPPAPPGSMPEEPVAEPDFLAEEYEYETDDTQQRPAAKQAEAKRGGVPILAILAAIVAVVVVAILIIPSLTAPTVPPTMTAQSEVVVVPTNESVAAVTEDAGAPTSETQATEAVVPTRRPTITPTIEGAVVETTPAETVTDEAASTETAFTAPAAVTEALAAFPLSESGIVAVQTALGNTVIANVCSAPGREMRMLLPQVMNAFARESGSLDATVQAIGASLVNCDTGAAMLTVATEMVTAQNYAQGDLSDTEFAATWQPQ